MTYDFDAPDADLILVSSDTIPVEYHVHKFILSAASPFFKDMLALPQPKLKSHSEVPVIPVSETHDIIDTLLRFLYPIPDPSITSLEELTPILAASIKYDFLSITDTLRRMLVSPEFLRAEPMRVFVIASRFHLGPETRLASRYTLHLRLLDSDETACEEEDLAQISALDYHRLLSLHRRYARAIRETLVRPAEEVKCLQCNGNIHAVNAEPKWWIEFKKRALEVLVERPTGEGIFEMRFLAKCAIASGCPRCPGSVLDAHAFLMGLKREIEDIPSTI